MLNKKLVYHIQLPLNHIFVRCCNSYFQAEGSKKAFGAAEALDKLVTSFKKGTFVLGDNVSLSISSRYNILSALFTYRLNYWLVLFLNLFFHFYKYLPKTKSSSILIFLSFILQNQLPIGFKMESMKVYKYQLLNRFVKDK